MRKIIFKRGSKLTTKEKQSVTGKYIAKMKKDKTMKTLVSIYQDGMTQAELTTLSGKSLRTVKKYWKEIKP